MKLHLSLRVGKYEAVCSAFVWVSILIIVSGSCYHLYIYLFSKVVSLIPGEYRDYQSVSGTSLNDGA